MTGYPLEVLLALRARAERDAAHGLAGALGRERDAARALDAAATALARHAGRVPVAADEAPCAAALQGRSAHEARRRVAEERLREGVRAAERALAVATATVGARRGELERARGASEAVGRHHARWERSAARRREAREQARADDLVSARGEAS